MSACTACCVGLHIQYWLPILLVTYSTNVLAAIGYPCRHISVLKDQVVLYLIRVIFIAQLICNIVWFQKISMPTPWVFFFYFDPSPHPSRNSILASYFPLKILAFATSHPLGISSDHPSGGMGIFWNHTLFPEVIQLIS